MKKNRYLLCLLLCGVLLYYGVPKLTPSIENMAGIFAISWLLFALMVAAGNLTALLYSPEKTKQKHHPSKRRPIGSYKKKRIRYYQ